MAIDYTPTDHFGADAALVEQTGTVRESRTYAQVLAADGDLSCETSYDVVTNYENTYQHCGASNGIVTDAGTLLTAFGDVVNSDTALTTGATITLDHQAYPELSLEGHNHASNAHATADSYRVFSVAAAIHDQQGFGITLAGAGSNELSTGGNYAITFTLADAEPTQVVYTVSLEHMDINGADGNHKAGENRTCRVEVSITGVGSESGVAFGSNWSEDDNEDTDSNQESDTFTKSAHLYVDAT